MEEGSWRGNGGQRNPSLPGEGTPATTITPPQLCQESLSPLGWGISTHCVNGEDLWSALQTEGIAACMDMEHIMGCKRRIFWDCIGSMGCLGRNQMWGKGGIKGVWGGTSVGE